MVSIIVPTFNSATFLEKCLLSFRKQAYRNIEIIIVDNYSEDRTKKIAENYGAIVIEIDAKRSRARNSGAERAEGDCVFFVDSDMELDLRVVDQCVKKVEQGWDGIIVPEISIGEGFWSRCKALEKSCYVDDETIEAARFFKKSAFRAVHGYDEQLEAGEDWDLNQRIKEAGFKIGRVNALIKHNEGELRLWETLKKKYRYGKSIGKYKNKHPRESRSQLVIIRPAFQKNWKKLVREPEGLVGMFFIKFCEFGAGLLGMLSNRIRRTEETTNSRLP